MFCWSEVALLKFYDIFTTKLLFPPTDNISITQTHRRNLHAYAPPRLKSKPGGVSAVSAQGAEGPHDEFEAGVVDVPQVDVLMGDLHGALPVDVQVWGGHKVHVEALCKDSHIFFHMSKG